MNSPVLQRSAPPHVARLLVWFVIYFVGLFVVLCYYPSATGFFIFYPMGFIGLYPGVELLPFPFPLVAFVSGFVVYIAHFIASLWVRTLKSFCILVTGLILLVVLDTIGSVMVITNEL